MDPSKKQEIYLKKRRRLDGLFACVGAGLVLFSFGVLVVLFAQLFMDGRARFSSSHLVKNSGYAPGMRDIVGVLNILTGNENEQKVALLRDEIVLEDAVVLIPELQLKEWNGKRVKVLGEAPQPGHNRMIPDSVSLEVAAVSDARPFEVSSHEINGVLQLRDEGKWSLLPDMLYLDAVPKSIDPAWIGKTVAVSSPVGKAQHIELLQNQSFLNSMPSREPGRAGVKSALVGSILVVLLTMFLAVPFAVAAGLWLEEYGKKNWLTALIEINIANLAGVPSIVWGLMSLGFFVYYLDFGRSILTASLTLALLVIPVIIMATREAIRAIPNHIREASYAVGATRLQTVRYHILPYSMGGIMTGSIIGLSRAIGETAPLITIGALTYIAFLPEFSWSAPFSWIHSGFTVLPIQMFNWVSRPDTAFQENAAAAGVLLLAITLCMNAVAITLRYRMRKNLKW